MATPDSQLATLEKIRVKVRRLTHSLSVHQLSNESLDEYINTFVLYDLPPNVAIESLRTVFTFFTKPYVGTYKTITDDADDPFYNFKSEYAVFNPVVYCNSTRLNLYMQRQNFYSNFGKMITKKQLSATGDGVTTAFSGTLDNVPVEPGTVAFSSQTATYEGLVVCDSADASSLTGQLIVPNDATSVGTINYVTGVYSFDFPSAPAASAALYVEANAYCAGVPTGILYLENDFTLRPIPKETYRVEVEVSKRPTVLLAITDIPFFSEWWEFIAYGAATKLLLERQDMKALETVSAEYQRLKSNINFRFGAKTACRRITSIYSRPQRGITWE